MRRGLGGNLQLAISDAGALIYMPGRTETDQGPRVLAIGDRSGTITRVMVPPAAYSHVRVSPDGTRAAIGVDDGNQASVQIYALNGRSAVRRLTLEGKNRFPVWSPDSQWLAFQSNRAGDVGLFRQRADGTGVAERLTTAASGEEHVPESWSPDGRLVSFTIGKVSGAATGSALWMLSLADKKTAPFAGVTSWEPIGSVFSPDGKWLAYATANDPTATDQAAAAANRGIFVQPLPPTGAVYPVPRQLVDFHPAWSASSAELVFTAAAITGQMVAVGITTAGEVTFAAPLRFPATVTGDRLSRERRAWDILPDGRFIGIVSGTVDATRSAPAEMLLVLNWFEELKKKVPVP